MTSGQAGAIAIALQMARPASGLLTAEAPMATLPPAMTTDEMLVFCGGVLGPALVARDVAASLRRVPQLAPNQPARPDRADRLLEQVFPEGLQL